MRRGPAVLLAASLPAVLLAAVLLTAGCASESDLLKSDPNLTAADLRTGKIAVLGVVKFETPDQIRPPLIDMLEHTLSTERQDIPMVRSDSVRQILGTDRYRKLLLGYEYQGSLDQTALEEIQNSLRGVARFVLVARVEKDNVRNSARGYTEPDTSRAFQMGVTGRDAQVAVSLYDLTKRALVYSAKYSGSSEATKPILIRPPVKGDVTKVTVGPAEDLGYPDAPELARALEEPFRAFARALPGGTSPSGTRPASPGGAP